MLNLQNPLTTNSGRGGLHARSDAAPESQRVCAKFQPSACPQPLHDSMLRIKVLQPSKRIRLTDEPCIVAMCRTQHCYCCCRCSYSCF